MTRISTNWIAVALFCSLIAGCDEQGGSSDTGDTADGASMTDVSDSGSEDTTDTAMDSGADTEGDTTDADAGPSCLECEDCVACEYQTSPERTCALPGDERPPRCDADPTTMEEWGAGSVLTGLELTTNAALDCCVNVDGSPNGSLDNKVGQLVDSLPLDVDRQVKYGLLYEDFAALAEFDGLESLDQDTPFDANIYLGRFTSKESTDYVVKANPNCDLDESDCELEGNPGRTFAISPETLDDGTHPQAHFPDATIDDGTIEAGPGRVTLNVSLEDLGTFAFDVRGATFTATADETTTDLEGDGLAIERGEIGGYVLMRDIVGQINHLLEPCNCLDNPEAAVTYPNDDESDPDLLPNGCRQGTLPADECEITCTDTVEMRAEQCGSGTGLICKQTEDLCTVVNLLKDLPDLDTDGDGQKDAISAGALFETTAAQIDGVAEYMRGSEQSLTSGSRTVLDEVFAGEDGWVAVYDDRRFGSDALLGHTEIEAGHHRDFEVGITQPNSAHRVWAVLHRDDGLDEGNFEAAEDSKAKRYPEMNDYVQTSFWVRPDDE